MAREPGASKRRPASPDAGYSARPRIDKVGVKAGMRVSLLGVSDAAFDRELAERGAAALSGRVRAASDVVFAAMMRASDLARLERLRDAIVPEGAIWILWQKGRPELREDDIRRAALRVGLVDVKVIAFSETLSGLKLVIPVARRAGSGRLVSDRAKSGRKRGGLKKSL